MRLARGAPAFMGQYVLKPHHTSRFRTNFY
jgi:hypothetical protein